jgi:uncharacterized membrane protein
MVRVWQAVRNGWRLFVAGLQTLAPSQRIWFLAASFAYLLFLVLIPPFQTNDEDAHWMRLWTIASGNLTCKEPIPSTAFDFIAASHYWPVRAEGKHYHFSNLDAELAIKGRPDQQPALGAPCLYMPLSYTVPALAVRLFANPYDPARPAHIFHAFYAARASNLLLMFAGVLLFLAFVPALRNLTLLLYSLPMAIHQGISINQESTILFLFFAMMILWWRPSTVAGAAIMAVLISLLSFAKPVYLVFFVLWLCYLVRLCAHTGRSRRFIFAMLPCALVPVIVWSLWTHFIIAGTDSHQYLPSWVDMPGQVAYLKAHPWVLPKIVLVQLRDLFGREHMRGGWVSVLGVMGWADFEIGDRAYACLLLAAALAVLADLGARVEPPPAEADRRWQRIIPFFTFFLIIPAIAVAMYVQFTSVGSEFALGTSGRYLHIPYFGMLAFGLEGARRRWGGQPWARSLNRMLPWACLLLCTVGVSDALHAIVNRFYL